jgi:hypothetical protein
MSSTVTHPLRFAIAAALVAATGTAAAVPDFNGGFERWRNYALRSVTPDFSWAQRPAALDVRPTALSEALETRGGAIPALQFSRAESPAPFDVGFAHSYGLDSPALTASAFSPVLLPQAGPVLERTVIAPSLSRALDDGSQVTASVVLAHQRFASWNFGSGLDAGDTATPLAPESSFGSGVRVEMRRQFEGELGFTTAYQSKVNMNAFQNYRGVFSDPGDFDLPAVASAGLAWNAAPDSSLEFGVSRVMYSEITAFTSRGLPPRLLQSIGDGDSPAFAWRDLTVYSLGWNWQASPADRFGLRYSTQQQPEPSASVYARALRDSYTDNNLALSWLRNLGGSQALRLAASYSSSPFYLGTASSLDWQPAGDQLEVEAVYSIDF